MGKLRVISLALLALAALTGCCGGADPLNPLATYTIFGQVLSASGSGIPGVTLTFTGGWAGAVTPDADGGYSKSGLGNGTYTITPSLAGWTFSPASTTVTIPDANLAGVGFVGTYIGVWSMFGHDQQHTHRSPFTGPATNALKWSYATLGPVNSAPAIGADGTVYVGSSDGHLYALDPNSQSNRVKWVYPPQGQIGAVNSSPAIGADGTVYVGSDDGNLYAIDPNGNALGYNWPYSAGGLISSSPVISAEGTVYVGSRDHYVYAIDQYGSDVWTPPFLTGGKVFSSPALGADGTVYVGCDDHKLYAINAAGGLVAGWPYATNYILNSSPAIGADGTVYVGTVWDGDAGDAYGYLDAINPNGTRKWQAFLGGHANSSSPAIGADGTVYIGTQSLFLSFNAALYAIRPDGSEKWSHDFGVADDYLTSWDLAVDKGGTVYVGCSSNDGMSSSNIYAIDAAGAQKWVLPLGGDLISSPALGADGTVYVGCSNNSLYAIGPGGG